MQCTRYNETLAVYWNAFKINKYWCFIHRYRTTRYDIYGFIRDTLIEVFNGAKEVFNGAKLVSNGGGLSVFCHYPLQPETL